MAAKAPPAAAPAARLIHNSFFDDPDPAGETLICLIALLTTVELNEAVTRISNGPVTPLGTRPRPVARPSESVCVIKTRSDPNAAPGPAKGV